MSSTSVYYRHFKKAVLGDREERVVGDFVFYRAPEGTIGLLTKEAYDIYKGNLDHEKFGKKIKEDKENLLKTPPVPISDEELNFIE